MYASVLIFSWLLCKSPIPLWPGWPAHPNLMGFNLQTSYSYCVTTQATRVQSVMNRVSDIKIKVNFIQFLSSKKKKPSSNSYALTQQPTGISPKDEPFMTVVLPIFFNKINFFEVQLWIYHDSWTNISQTKPWSMPINVDAFFFSLK